MARKRQCRPCDRLFSRADAKRLAKQVGIDMSVVSLDEIVAGLNEEREHGDITCCDPEMTALIAKAHLDEDPAYYTKLNSVLHSDFEEES